ncbi:MAG: hypothetical protein ACPGID_09485 [Rubricella sp.]
MRFAAAIFSLAVMFSGSAVAQGAGLDDGLYTGLGRAEGLELRLVRVGEQVQGTFTEVDGMQSTIVLTQSGGVAVTGTVLLAGDLLFVMVEPVARDRILFGTVPLDEAGLPIANAAQAYDFVRSGADGR